MIKNFAIKAYLILFKCVFSFFNLFKLKRKTVFVSSFSDNTLFVINALKKDFPNEEVVLLNDIKCKVDTSNFNVDFKYDFNNYKRPLDFIKSIYHLATSRIIFIDNYFGFLAAFPSKKRQKVIQLWHAAGAIKKFALADKTVDTRSFSAQKRFIRVYGQFDYTVVGSEYMADIFLEAFNITDSRILRTGIPRTDFFFDESAVSQARSNLLIKFPFIQERKVILYAPTFRDGQFDSWDSQLDFKLLEATLSEEYILFVKFHPSMNIAFENESLNFIYDISDMSNINHLLTIVDVLITDYSSLPFEFALLNRPIIFYVPDLTEYKKERGIWEVFSNNFPGPLCFNTSELIHSIKDNKPDLTLINQFSKSWNVYSDGSASHKIISSIYKHDN